MFLLSEGDGRRRGGVALADVFEPVRRQLRAWEWEAFLVRRGFVAAAFGDKILQPTRNVAWIERYLRGRSEPRNAFTFPRPFALFINDAASRRQRHFLHWRTNV